MEMLFIIYLALDYRLIAYVASDMKISDSTFGNVDDRSMNAFAEGLGPRSGVDRASTFCVIVLISVN
jgi:hypothetical protein